MRAEAGCLWYRNCKNSYASWDPKSLTKVRVSQQEIKCKFSFCTSSITRHTVYARGRKPLDAAGTDIGRLNVIISEFMVSLYGNGIDAYNAYRRTGAPTTMQISTNPGGFIRSFLYPASEANEFKYATKNYCNGKSILG
jgi:hypothetical protein